MPHTDFETTNPSQLRSLRNWEDHTAWLRFQESYDPVLRCCCASVGLKGTDIEDVRQETWIEVAKRMRSFVYDPNGSFRGWLWKVCLRKALDFMARKNRDSMFSLDERDEWVRRRRDADRIYEVVAPGGMTTVEPGNTFLSDLFREAEEIQAIVKGRVAPRTWEGFWLVGISLWTARETAEHLQMSLASVLKAKERVLRSLQAEGRKRAIGDHESR
jgi:RNA polymerase sigma factor (sigma-70 family)